MLSEISGVGSTESHASGFLARTPQVSAFLATYFAHDVARMDSGDSIVADMGGLRVPLLAGTGATTTWGAKLEGRTDRSEFLNQNVIGLLDHALVSSPGYSTLADRLAINSKYELLRFNGDDFELVTVYRDRDGDLWHTVTALTSGLPT
jgi:hypothetical protein